MRPRLYGVLVCSVASLTCGRAAENSMWFDTPATRFTESVPLGNGRLGAMVFGGVNEERIVLNETGMWSGSPQAADRPDAYKALPRIRELLLAGKNAEAETLMNATFTCAGLGSARGKAAKAPYGCYQVLGNLRLTFPQGPAAAPVANYRRELDLANAVAHVTYERDGVRFARDVFVSAPDQVVVIVLRASKPGALAFELALDRPENASTTTEASGALRMTGQLPDGFGGTHGVRFAARVGIADHDGQLSTRDATLALNGATHATILVAALTDIRTFAGRRSDDPLAATAEDLTRATQHLATLSARHTADFRRYYDRVALQLGEATEPSGQPDRTPPAVPARLVAVAGGANDPGLAALFFNFGRYLLISSSRAGGLPPNLQGLWAEEIQTPWNADWHLNVNVQMNYWPAEICGLPELVDPLFAFVGSLQSPGAKTAQAYYGARGWVAHVLANPWGFTAPGEEARWGASNDGSAWLCQPLWDHFLFTGDREFLARVYPILKGSAQFYLDSLIEEPSHHWLVTAPSNSPENSFRLPNGQVAHICLGPTIDQQLLRYLFDACRQAGALLDVDADFRRELAEKRARLVPTRVGSDGRVMEWLEEYAEPDPKHRHVSHLWGLYPGSEIALRSTPELAAAARKSLEVRGDGGTGWSLAYKLNLWARLHDGDRCERLLHAQLTPVSASANDIVMHGGGTYPNLFDAHPPFQIDGNFGATAGIAEMLLQSGGEIELLPALPTAWPDGEVRGLRARGGFIVDETWRRGALVRVAVHRIGAMSEVRLRYRDHVRALSLNTNATAQLDGELRETP
jgi:alpha-L-fucosidase 2